MKRPVSVVVFGLLNVGCALINGVIVLVLLSLRTQPNQPVTQALKEVPVMASALQAWIAICAVLLPLYLVSGVGLLLMKRWARSLAIGTALFQIAISIVTLFTQFTSVGPAVIARAPEIDVGPLMLMVVIRIILALAGLSYSVLVIVFLRREHVTAAFAPGVTAFGPRAA